MNPQVLVAFSMQTLVGYPRTKTLLYDATSDNILKQACIDRSDRVLMLC